MTRLVRSGLAIVATAAAACGAPDRPAGTAAIVAPPPVPAEAPTRVGGLRVQVLEVTRVGDDVLEVRLALINPPTAPSPVVIDHQFAGDPADSGTIADATLVDPVSRRRYFVIRGPDRRPRCSTNIAPIRPGETRQIWAQFLAPPRAVTRIVLSLPQVADLPAMPLAQEPGVGGPRM